MTEICEDCGISPCEVGLQCDLCHWLSFHPKPTRKPKSFNHLSEAEQVEFLNKWDTNEEMFHAEFSSRVAETEWVLTREGARIQDKEYAGRFIEAEAMVDVASYDGEVAR